jgi:tetratricopeptide (TPR) repeat protein
LGNAWIGLGIGYYVLGEPETARKYMEKGIKMNSDAGMRELLSAYYVTLIMIDSDSGDLERAQGRAEEALRLSQENQEMWPEGLSRVILGRVLGKRNERPLAEAEASILAGIKILEEVKAKPIVAQAQFYLGELYADAGQTKKALASLKRAEIMFQNMGMDYWLRKTQPLLQKLETSVS